MTTENEKYPQNIIFGYLKDKIELLESVKAGDTVTVHFDINYREWNEKHFVNLNAWKIENQSASASTDANASASLDVALDEEPPF